MTAWYCPGHTKTSGFFDDRPHCRECCGFVPGSRVRVSGDGSWLDAEDGRPRKEVS